ncbi:hypothetical protein C7293_15695 [filamentous cyanobacterium CCT1]|nr:hypothetical protein C7293_15695 [filamentous cyanobacterium CCT1]PSN80344.1 hypothetical protein C8B47_07060 [filamentous cyanobacterium CCP4]
MAKPTSSNSKPNAKPIPDQAPDQAVVASNQAQPMVPDRAAGSTLQEAETAARQTRPQGNPVDHPIATNFSEVSSGDSKTAGASSVSGPYETDQAATDKDRVSLQNNPNTPDDEAVQGTLPNTGPLNRPIDNSDATQSD